MGLVLFGVTGGSWLFVIPLILLPDVSAVGYLAGPRVGAFSYNLLHTWALGFIALGLGTWLDMASRRWSRSISMRDRTCFPSTSAMVSQTARGPMPSDRQRPWPFFR